MYAVPKIAYSVAEFCAAAGIGRSFFYEELKAGRIRVIKAGRRTLIPASELTDWLGRLRLPTAKESTDDREDPQAPAEAASATYRVRSRRRVA